jgi:hypothetical protein
VDITDRKRVEHLCLARASKAGRPTVRVPTARVPQFHDVSVPGWHESGKGLNAKDRYPAGSLWQTESEEMSEGGPFRKDRPHE